MKYTVFYKSENGKNYFERVDAVSKGEAELKLRRKYNDIKEIVQISEG